MQHAYQKPDFNLSSRQQLLHARQRILLIIFCICSLFSLEIYRLIELGIASSEDLTRFYDYNHVEEFIPHRSEIVDRNGVLLASNLTINSIYANPKKILDANEVVNKISKILPDVNSQHLLADLKNKNKSFVWIKRDLTPNQTNEINKLGLPGVYFEKGEKRVYPYGNLLSHLLGFVDIDGNGIAGIEKFFDSELLDPTFEEKFDYLKLSIDVRAQNILREELLEAVNMYEAAGAVGVITDVNNGELLAMVSLPDFNPHQPGKAKKEALFNKASTGVYEMGSTFKILTMAMALDSKKVKLTDIYDVHKPLKVANYSITDFHKKGNFLSVAEIFLYSSNIGTAQIAMDFGTDLQKQYVKKFALDKPVGLEIPERANSLLPSNKAWSDISTLTISYGYGVATSPLHLIQAINSTVNGGFLHPLTAVKKDKDTSIKQERIISEKTSQNLKKLLRLVVADGTGRRAAVPGYFVGGKTGTANKSAGGSYNRNDRLSSFVGVFPMHKPKYSILIMLDEPQLQAGQNYATGGIVSAPVAANVISRIGPTLGVQTVDENSSLLKQQFSLPIRVKNESQSL